MRPRSLLDDFAQRSRVPMVVGHRGCPTMAPENSLASFALIREHGIAGVELDVHQCATGEIVVTHDDSLARVAGVPLAIRGASLGELREHDIGSFFDPSFAAERVPLLEEVFEVIGPNVFLDVEIKHYESKALRAQAGGVEAKTVELIRRHGLVRRCIVSSFDPLVIRRVRLIAPDIPVAAIYASTKDIPYLLRRNGARLVSGATVMKPNHHDATRAHIARQHRRHRLVMPWTVDDPAVAAELAAHGVDAVITNRPVEIREALRQTSR